MSKKLALIAFLLFSSGAASANDSWRQVRNWSIVNGIYSDSTHLSYGGYISLLPVNKRMTHFIIQVGPGSWNRGCRVESSKVAVVQRVRPTRLVAKQKSPTRRGWRNYVYEVNGGHDAAFAQQVNTEFSGPRGTQCYYRFLYTNLEDDNWEDDEDDDWEDEDAPEDDDWED